MTPFETLNDHIVYTNVKSRSEAIKLKNDSEETAASGKTVVIFFENRYHLYLAPGQDPYQIRKEIEQYMDKLAKANESGVDTNSKPVAPKTKKRSF